METPNAITPELVKQALDASHENCEAKCIHIDACLANHDAIFARIKEEVAAYLAKGYDPYLGCFFLGLHVGYRLHQLEAEPLPSEKLN